MVGSNFTAWSSGSNRARATKTAYVMLSPHLLELLRAWVQERRARQGWLFPGREARPAPMTTRQLRRACHAAAHMAEIGKRVSPHTLRHSFATHLLEQKTDIRVIQVLLGHAKHDTTALHTRVATKTIREIARPARSHHVQAQGGCGAARLTRGSRGPTPPLEVADIFRDHGSAWRSSQCGPCQPRPAQGNVGHRELPHGSARHVARCEDCAHTTIAYNSCRNRHCPKCQGAAAKQWLAERAADLLPVPYYHVVFTLPAAISNITYHNKSAIYDLLLKTAAETLITIAADPKHPFGGPQAVLAYLSHYTHRVAIANSRLLAFNDKGVTFKCKDYRIEGPGRYKTMTLATDEFIRRFLIHVLPTGFHRIRHTGLFAKSAAANNIVRARQLLTAQKPQAEPTDTHQCNAIDQSASAQTCPTVADA